MPRTNQFPCPNCGKLLDANTAPWEKHDPGPATGDVSVCFYCAHIGLFEVADDGGVSVRRMTAEERKEHEADEQWPKVLKAQALVAERLRKRATWN